MVVTKATQIGAALVAAGYLTQQNLDKALAEQVQSGRLLGRVLVGNKYVTDEQMAMTIAAQQGLSFIDLRRYDVDLELVKTLTEIQVRRYSAIILEDNGDSYLVGLVNPTNLRTQDELSNLLGRPIIASVITLEQFNKTVDRSFRKTDQIDEYANELKLDLERDSNVVDLNQIMVSIGDVEAPVIKLLQTIFEEAVQMRASDVHIEPQETKLVVRYRIDGILHAQVDTDIRIATALMVRLKLLSGMDISEKRLPQDGRLLIKTGSDNIDIRMSTVPTQYGESAVMRLLIQTQGLLDIKRSGMPPDLMKRFKKLIRNSHGIVLVTGPTGSGKTTTLYGALEELNTPKVKILTVEDPVEYRISGINQVQVNEKIDLTFARLLRSFLRQDPDILLVGEIRDEETAQIAARAAMTGHLVLSSLHTNDAVSTPVRLLDMGVPGYIVASTLLGVVSQLLLRLVCTHCSEPYQPSHEELEWIKHFIDKDVVSKASFSHGKGCTRCNNMGFSGRTGIFELLEMTPLLSEAIHKADPLHFETLARKQMADKSLVHRALELVFQGKTTISEAMSAVTSGTY
jgi:MSHA biogenesis protein MshE